MMSLQEIFGKNNKIRVLDLIIPLSEKLEFGVVHVARGTGMYPKDIERMLTDLVDRKILILCGNNLYRKNPASNQVWALNNLIQSIYVDRLRAESTKKMGLE